jgi:hypothetical protein
MSEPDVKKTISINPELFKVSNDKGRKREKKERRARPTQRANPLKKELMNKIKSHASKHNKTLKNPPNFEGSFEDHMEYLSNLAKKRKLKIHSELPSELAKTPAVSNTTKVTINTDKPVIDNVTEPSPVVQQEVIPVIQTPPPNVPVVTSPLSAPVAEPEPVAVSTATTLSEPAPEPETAPVPAPISMPAPPSMPEPPSMPIPVNAPQEPPYGILKRGNKPTFRQWHKRTQKNRPSISKPRELVQQIKKKYSLGKNKNRVSIFLKNKKTRKKIQDEMSSLKKIPIDQVKEYLRKHNMIKAGSNAPHDVLRQLYQTSHLAGEINNKSNDTLIHNYLAEEKEEE